jgi:predicted  nucleic acid-binding Zn ribbon protein
MNEWGYGKDKHRKCPHCGKRFQPKNEIQKFCTYACRNAHRLVVYHNKIEQLESRIKELESK